MDINSLPRFCVSSFFLLLWLTSPLKIYILTMPQIHKFFFPVFISLYRSRRRKWSTVQIFYEESCGDAQDLSSPDEDEPLLSNSHSFTGNFSILRLLFEIASLRVCTGQDIKKKIHTNSKLTEHSFLLYKFLVGVRVHARITPIFIRKNIELNNKITEYTFL